ncbi:nitric oxide reductase activation protein [Bacillus tianshenii]|uniref:Nitric oxide reductase activation protein n=1 Tax=Sutcliffiella tianshenii TaxID=1463404 RepID=A0ABS2NXA7_9BACI|nr:VWA domain-containing protein [Bacillus tianshenii]MBM7619306.1 nitric oxide reductase activation protein [Bacillus tianshenii]
MRPIVFNDKKIDSFLFMELADLAMSLAKKDSLEVSYAFKSYYDPYENTVFISLFWDNHPHVEKIHGLKSDVFLRTIGTITHTDFSSVSRFMTKARTSHLFSFSRQLFMLLEDLRLEELCKRERPGTTKSFLVRRAEYRKYFRSQLKVNLDRAISTDALYNLLYLLLTTDDPLEEIPSINNEIDPALPFIIAEASKCYEVSSTVEIEKICRNILEVLYELLDKDMLNMYFLLPDFTEKEEMDDTMTFDDLKRNSDLKNDDKKDKETEDEDIHEEKLPTWHRESESNSQSFLQFDLEQGTKMDLMGEGGREGEDGDQAMGYVQGSSKQTNKNDYSSRDLDVLHNDEKKEGGAHLEFGKENKYAYPIFLNPSTVTNDQKNEYEKYKLFISSYQKKLKQLIQKTLEHKKILPRSELAFGRLSKKLLPWFVEENPKMFYKRDNPSIEIDAVFTLLVDCSASMFDKMEQTKFGITLFHEALKSVQVPHEVVGFWEDTNDATSTSHPNYFKSVIDFSSSTRNKSGPEILQLEPEEDNRDGYAIRHMSKRLLNRSEKQKFLLVFSDGEPAAMQYEQNGIVDTHQAVMDARKSGIEVINVFLSNGEIEESQVKTIQNMYGKYSILVPDIEELPDVLFPLLKKLLLKSL